MNDELLELAMNRYREHGNSLNSAQLICIQKELEDMESEYSDEELKRMLTDSFMEYIEKSAKLKERMEIQKKPYTPMLTKEKYRALLNKFSPFADKEN